MTCYDRLVRQIATLECVLATLSEWELSGQRVGVIATGQSYCQTGSNKRLQWAHVWLTCRGTTDALCAAGYLTPAMLKIRAERRKGDSRFMRDEHGNKFGLHRSATKDAPARMTLTRHLKLDMARKMPGVGHLLPETVDSEPAQEPSREPRWLVQWCQLVMEYGKLNEGSKAIVRVKKNES